MSLGHLHIFYFAESRTPEPLREIDVVATLVRVGRPSSADLVELTVEAVDGSAESPGAANGDPAVSSDDSLEYREGFVTIEPMQSTADGDRLENADVLGQVLDSRLDQVDVHASPGRFHARRLQHFGLHVDAHAGSHKRREANGQRSRPAADVDQTGITGDCPGGLESLAARDFSKEAGRVGLAISRVVGSGRIKTSHGSNRILTEPEASSIFKIAHIDTGKDFRGGQELLLSLARGLRLKDHRQLIVCPVGGPLAKRAAAEHFELAPLGLSAIGRLRRRLSAERFDIVHAHDGRAQNVSFLASAGLPLRRVASRQVAFSPRHALIHRWKYTMTCHGIIANSESVRRVLIASGIPAQKIEVIPPGIEIPADLPSASLRARARARWGFSDEDFVIGHAGAFTREKGQDVALEAARLLAPKLPHARMLLVGDGPQRRNQTEGIAILPGFLDDLSEFYAALDLFIMPSRSEGWGLTALGAMANGLAVIASDVDGLRELVEHGKTGWLVPSDSPSALAEAIDAAALDPGRRSEYGRNGRERAAHFSIERTVERTEQFYTGLLAASQTAT
jgi:glycosyltransferase involved in cell wall biosynthesis